MTFKKIQKNDKILEISQEKYPDSPRDNSVISKMVCFHKRYNLGDSHELNSKDFAGWDEIENYIKDSEDPYVIKPLYLYDHSGIAISTSSFSSRSDSGQVGFVYINKETMKDFYPEWKRVTKKRKQQLEEKLEKEVETYNKYVKGNVFQFTIKDGEGDIVDQMRGFIGDNLKENGLLDYIKDSDEELGKELEKQL